MQAAFLITAAPHETQVVHSAWLCAAALLQGGHTVNRIFLQGDAVFLAESPTTPLPSGNDNATRWEELITAWSLPASVCAGSANERALEEDHLRAGWHIGGLGDWVTACSAADRILPFTGDG
ncbi:DsrE/DsrF/TusD sulfur relay family protein [Halomonadaceae bacterium KBTZ08]